MTNREISNVEADEEIVGLTIGSALANTVAILVVFVASRLFRTPWSEMAGDALYWLLGAYIWVCFARFATGPLSLGEKSDTSFMFNIVVLAIASFAVITGPRIVTAPLITLAIKLIH